MTAGFPKAAYDVHEGIQIVGAVRKDSGGDLAGADGNLGPLQMDSSGNLRVNVIAGGGGSTNATIVAPIGQMTMATSVAVVIASDQSDVPVNIDKYGGTSTTLGQKAMSASIPVTIASDQSTPLATTAITTRGKIDNSGSGDVTIVAGVSLQTVRVYKIFLTVSATTNLVIKDGSTALTGAMTFFAGGSFVLDFNPADPWFITTAGNAFVINSSASVQMSGRVYYTQS